MISDKRIQDTFDEIDTLEPTTDNTSYYNNENSGIHRIILYASDSGLSIQQICDLLNRRKFVNAWGRPFTYQTVRNNLSTAEWKRKVGLLTTE